MRVSVVGPTHPLKGGIAQHTTEVAIRLAAAAHDVELVSWSAMYPQWLYPGRTQTADEGSESVYPNTRYPLSWYRPWSWWFSISPKRVDVIVICLAAPIQVPAYWLLTRRIRFAAFISRRSSFFRRGKRSIEADEIGVEVSPSVVLVVHNVRPHENRFGERTLLRWMFRAVDRVLTHSESESVEARELGGSDVCWRPLPFHFPGVIEPGPVGDMRRGVIGFFGFVRPYKGVDVLIRALAMTVSRPQLLIAGEFWQDINALTELAEGLGVLDLIEFRDEYVPADELVGLIRSVDAVVLPYRSGTGSQQPLIAFESRTPVIATKVGDLPSRVRHDVDGLLCEPADAASLAEAIDVLYQSGKLDWLRSNIRSRSTEMDWAAYLDGIFS